MVEGMKAPLRQHGPGLGSLLDGAPPPVRPGQLRRSLEIGEPRVSGHWLSWAWRCRRTGREKEQKCDARSKTHGRVLQLNQDLNGPGGAARSMTARSDSHERTRGERQGG